jgi:hypothetical protein
MKKMFYILIILFILFIISFCRFAIGRIRLENTKHDLNMLCIQIYGEYKMSDVPASCYQSFIEK